MRILSPTENKRLNELIGFVGLSMSVLLALSLLSYSPRDSLLMFPRRCPQFGQARNWIGPVGAHLARHLLSILRLLSVPVPGGDVRGRPCGGFAARILEAPVLKLVGAGNLLVSFPSEFTLIHMPGVRGALPAGDCWGPRPPKVCEPALILLAANLVSVMLLITSAAAYHYFFVPLGRWWLKKPMTSEGFIGQLIARSREWRNEREAERLRKRVEEIKIAGRPPVKQQRVSAAKSVAEEELQTSLASKKPSPILPKRVRPLFNFTSRKSRNLRKSGRSQDSRGEN